jgi:hypothetical protein
MQKFYMIIQGMKTIQLKYITFCDMTQKFLKKPLDERRGFVPLWSEIAQRYGVKVLFSGMPIGVNENIVIVFETTDSEKFFIFQREWLALGTPEAGEYVKNTRTISVY